LIKYVIKQLLLFLFIAKLHLGGTKLKNQIFDSKSSLRASPALLIKDVVYSGEVWFLKLSHCEAEGSHRRFWSPIKDIIIVDHLPRDTFLSRAAIAKPGNPPERQPAR
jgi:hypothetical protein